MDPRGESNGARDRFNLARSRSMRAETDDEASIAFGAESARIAGNSRDPLGGTNYNFVAGG